MQKQNFRFASAHDLSFNKKNKLFYEWRKVYFSTIYNIHCRGINREMKLAFGLRNRQTFYTVGV